MKFYASAAAERTQTEAFVVLSDARFTTSAWGPDGRLYVSFLFLVAMPGAPSSFLLLLVRHLLLEAMHLFQLLVPSSDARSP